MKNRIMLESVVRWFIFFSVNFKLNSLASTTWLLHTNKMKTSDFILVTIIKTYMKVVTVFQTSGYHLSLHNLAGGPISELLE